MARSGTACVNLALALAEQQGWALDEDEEAVCARADEVTRLLGVRRLVVGHTPHFSGVR